MGNICRSPTAEGAFRRVLDERAPELSVLVDSAGTHAYHVGGTPDHRAQLAASRRGIDLSQQRARKITQEDFANFDLVLAMDELNIELLRESSLPEYHDRIKLFLEFAPHLGRSDVPDPYYGGTNGFELVLDLIEEAGLLGPRTALVHGNLPAPGEPERLAATGTSLVHCPGTHRFFGRDPFPLEEYRRAGVNLALGTDSLASNTALDMRREMALLRQAQPGLAPAEVWLMATRGGARALDLQGQVGCLTPGARADLVLFGTESGQADSILDELTAACPPVSRLFLAGRSQEPLPPCDISTGPLA